VFAFRRDETDILSSAKALLLVLKPGYAPAGSLKARAAVVTGKFLYELQIPECRGTFMV
jgi:hypothetical protein